MKIDPKIFKAYDIRGLSTTEITPELAELVGRAVVKYTGADVLVVGRDMRKTSPELLKALISGIVAAGADVINIGLTSTPMFYYAVGRQFEADLNENTSGGRISGAGIMVTASHNPKEYNGLKMVRGDLSVIGEGSGMEEIKELVIKGEFADRAEGNVMDIDVREEYVEKHLELVPKREVGRPRVVFDAGNGMAGYVTPHIMDAYGFSGRGKKMFFELDGSFPNHEANPVKTENLLALIAKVKSESADLGVAYDGDADRVGFVDEFGEPVRGDLMTAMIATEVLQMHPGTTILYDVRSSWAVKEAIEASGGKAVMSQVGHAFIKKQMRQIKASFAGELTAHYYFQDYYNAESSDLAMLMVLAAIHRTGKTLSMLVAPLKKYYHSGEINFTVSDKMILMKKIEEKYATLAASVIKIDGLRCEFGSWWFSVRTSNTEPLVRLNLEAKSEEEMNVKIKEISELIKNF